MKPLLAILFTIVLLAATLGLSELINFNLTFFMVLGTSFWAGMDSLKLELKRNKSGIAYSPVTIAIFCALLWIVAFPWYLILRQRILSDQALLKELAPQAPAETPAISPVASLTNEKMRDYPFLASMYRDGYFPDFLVDKVRDILVQLCRQIEATRPQSLEALYQLTHAATEKINALEAEFIANESELETEAREVMGADFEEIAKAYGFENADVEELIAPREW
jgi:hypothetical protein